MALWGVEQGVRAGFIVALVLAFAASVLQEWLIKSVPKTARIAEPNPARLWREMPAGLKHLLFSDILIRFCERIPDVFVVVWATRYIAHPVSELTFGWLSAVENMTAVLIYVPVAYMADRFGKKTVCLDYVRIFFLLPLSCCFMRKRCPFWWRPL